MNSDLQINSPPTKLLTTFHHPEVPPPFLQHNPTMAKPLLMNINEATRWTQPISDIFNIHEISLRFSTLRNFVRHADTLLLLLIRRI